jgi:hypothetical protein
MSYYQKIQLSTCKGMFIAMASITTWKAVPVAISPSDQQPQLHAQLTRLTIAPAVDTESVQFVSEITPKPARANCISPVLKPESQYRSRWARVRRPPRPSIGTFVSAPMDPRLLSVNGQMHGIDRASTRKARGRRRNLAQMVIMSVAGIHWLRAVGIMSTVEDGPCFPGTR